MANRIEHYIEYKEGLGAPNYRVFALQNMLKYLGFIKSCDGQFGPNTLKAVKKAQRTYGFDETGVVDTSFMAKLAEECIYLDPKDR